MIRSLAAYIVLLISYTATGLLARLGRAIPRRKHKATGRILITGTFHNPGWYRSHILPLSRSGAAEVILAVDRPQQALPAVSFCCPPRLLSRIVGRALSRFIWMIVTALQSGPDLCMGYHILPGACSALITAKLLGQASCYQMTGGPIELLGGGVFSESWLSGSLSKPSALLERLAISVVRQFDLVVVRGPKAKKYLEQKGIDQTVAIITGSVCCTDPTEPDNRSIDLLFVGRLTEIKQPMQFIQIVHAVKQAIPTVRAAVVGQGPALNDLKARTEDLGLTQCIEFMGKTDQVEQILARSKIFVLTSRSEGLSIAMAEAMAGGVVPVAANVGELGELVTNGVNGYLITPNRIDQYADHIVSLLKDRQLWTKCSQAAVEAVISQMDISVVSQCWNRQLQKLIGIPSIPAQREM